MVERQLYFSASSRVGWVGLQLALMPRYPQPEGAVDAPRLQVSHHRLEDVETISGSDVMIKLRYQTLQIRCGKIQQHFFVA